jgi:hypothetical protein
VVAKVDEHWAADGTARRDWAAYVGPVAGQDERGEAAQVAEWGAKLEESVARAYAREAQRPYADWPYRT